MFNQSSSRIQVRSRFSCLGIHISNSVKFEWIIYTLEPKKTLFLQIFQQNFFQSVRLVNFSISQKVSWSKKICMYIKSCMIWYQAKPLRVVQFSAPTLRKRPSDLLLHWAGFCIDRTFCKTMHACMDLTQHSCTGLYLFKLS